MSGDDLAYYRHRAETEIELSARATLLEGVAAHYQLANAYFARIGSAEDEKLPNHA